MRNACAYRLEPPNTISLLRPSALLPALHMAQQKRSEGQPGELAPSEEDRGGLAYE